MKVFIVDDSMLVVERLITMLSEISGIEIAGQAKGPIEAMNSIRKIQPDVIILDIRLNGGSGIDVLQNIKKKKAISFGHNAYKLPSFTVSKKMY